MGFQLCQKTASVVSNLQRTKREMSIPGYRHIYGVVLHADHLFVFDRVSEEVFRYRGEPDAQFSALGTTRVHPCDYVNGTVWMVQFSAL